MNRITKNNFASRGFFDKISISFIFFICFFYGCESRSSLSTESRSNQDSSIESEEIHVSVLKYKEENPKGMDTIIYEHPQELGGFLFATDDLHQILWGNKSGNSIRSADSNVVILSFIIEPDSTASSVRVLKGINMETDSIAIQAIKAAKWKPGSVNDSAVRSRFNFPIVF